MTTSTVASPLSPGSRLHSHTVALATAVDPVAAAAALRAAGRVMLTAGPGGRTTATLAAGELAVLSQPAGTGRAPLTDAVDFLAGLDLPPGTPAPEAAWYGLLGYDAVRDVERLPSRHQDTGRPVYEFFLPEVLVRCAAGLVTGRGPSAAAARASAERVARTLTGLGGTTLGPVLVGAGRFGFHYDEYVAAVHRAKQHILDGDVFQLVLSTAWTAPATVDGLRVYERLAVINPSPYHFWYAGPCFEAVGASPEPCLTLHDGQALIRPLAGTRPRGGDSHADQLAEDDLRSSAKEMAEHRMLVDLARNDLGRVCVPGTVSVDRLMAVERYSHVMHLTSDVRGRISGGRGTDELIRATFPAGTMTGTPKVRAMEIIDDLEPARRWLYSGAVGSFGLSHVDLFLTIRSVVLCDGEVRLQAGGGIVHDSHPAAEHAECLAKLGSGARAIGATLEGAAA
jgi:anthranilate synthase component I